MTDYKHTLYLPDTPFAMRGNMAQREPALLNQWEQNKLQQQIERTTQGRPLFVLHDGPPYANGSIHYGHILNKVLKDIVVKYKTMSGFRAIFRPGWDCHGLPIELQVDRDLGAEKKATMSVPEIRRACHNYALGFVDEQRKEFQRLGVFGQWATPYLTLNKEYEATIVDQLAQLAASGHLYKGKKPVHWCISCRTALAEAEVEYKERTSPSIYVKFAYADDPAKLHPSLTGKTVYFVIWTTTPWTLPANLAIALHPTQPYVAVADGNDILIMAEALVDEVSKATGKTFSSPLATIDGKAAIHTHCRHPFIDRASLLVFADYVTMEAGTGCVHTAPGHGHDDYQTGLANGLEIYAPVNDEGIFIADTPIVGGKKVYAANGEIIALLNAEHALLGPADATIRHNYPHCWRCKNPIIFRATPQWFVKLDHNALRQEALRAVDDTQWIPPWGRDRIHGMIETRPDWCLSRQRLWGVPIPAFYCTHCDNELADSPTMSHVARLFRQHGSDIWFASEADFLLPPDAQCPKCRGKSFRKENDIVDVWFESGVSWAAVCEADPDLWPIDLYLEGSDQHRGWFHSSLLAAVANRGRAPYKAVLTHGFVSNEQGQPYSKSLKNYVPPEKVISSRGAEIFRLWTSYVDYRSDMPFSEGILTQLADSYRKIRNTCRFFLGNLQGYTPDDNALSLTDMPLLDRWALSCTATLINDCRRAYETYEFHLVFRKMIEFCTSDMSAFYLDVIKDRLYCDAAVDRKQTQAVIYKIARGLTTLMAPILSFTAEEIWEHLPKLPTDPASVHLATITTWPDPDEVVLAQVAHLRQFRDVVLKALEPFRAQKHHSLDATVTLQVKQADYDKLSQYSDGLADLFIVSAVDLQITAGDTTVSVAQIDGIKCPRCWKWSTGNTTHQDNTLCPRCADVVRS